MYLQTYMHITALTEWADILILYHIIITRPCKFLIPTNSQALGHSLLHINIPKPFEQSLIRPTPTPHHTSTTIPYSLSPSSCRCTFQKQIQISTPLSRLLTPAAVVAQLLQSHPFISLPKAMPLPHHICLISANRGPLLGVTWEMVCLVSL